MIAGTNQLVRNAWQQGLAVPAFNIPYRPMMEPVVRAVRDTGAFALITVARPEWMKFEAGSPGAIRDEYERLKDERFMRLHLDHVPVIDEDNLRVDYRRIIEDAIELGYQSVMVDASRLPLEQNIAATREIVEMAHAAGVPVEGELGAVLGHEAGPLPPYEELFVSGKGFTDVDEARRFVRETEVDWLSVAIGNIHGAISGAARSERKIQARLNLEHLERIGSATATPLVLHGGTGIEKSCLLRAIAKGIAKINIGTAIRQPYETARSESVPRAQEAVYDTAVRIIREELKLEGSAERINPEEPPG
jgi:fructose-bisphosphate aldolase, class II